MKLRNFSVVLDERGKPTVSFELVPKTELERSFIKALDYHTQQGSGEALKVRVGYGTSNTKGAIMSTFWQVDSPHGELVRAYEKLEGADGALFEAQTEITRLKARIEEYEALVKECRT